MPVFFFSFHTWSQSHRLFHLAEEAFDVYILHCSFSYVKKKPHTHRGGKKAVISRMSSVLQVDPALVQLGTSGSRWGAGWGAQEQVDKVEKQQKASFWLLDPRNVPAFSFSFFLPP